MSLSHARRLGKTEKLERSEGQRLGLRVLIGKQQAMVSSSDRSPKMLAELVERTVAMARTVPEDPFCGLADPAEITHDWPALDMLDPEEPERRNADRARPRRRGGRARGRPASPIPKAPKPAGAARAIALVASNGFAGGYAGSHHGVSVAVIGGSGTEDGARLRFRERGLRRRSARPGRDRPKAPASAPSSGSARARCRPAAARWCSIRASRAA